VLQEGVHRQGDGLDAAQGLVGALGKSLGYAGVIFRLGEKGLDRLPLVGSHGPQALL
jgi:hypothetical protein